MKTYVFPGQGSQKKGMWEDIFDDFKEYIKKADEVLGYSIKELCQHDPHACLGQTQYTQPALYVVSTLMYLRKIHDTGTKPDFVAGHSLGEYCALFAAGAFSFECGVALVKKRGEIMNKAVGGGMAAVIGLDENIIKKILADNGLESVVVANYNSPSQMVISGLKEDIAGAQKIIETAGADLFIPLNVSGAFHSPYMDSAREEFKEYLAAVEFSEMSIPVISNAFARPYRKSDIMKNLTDQITSPVRWTETIQYLMAKGEMNFEEIGPGKVLTGLIKKIKIEAKPLVLSDIENVDKIINADSISPKIISKQKHQKNTKSGSNGEKPIKGGFITAKSLGCKEYKHDYKLEYAYVAGGMYKGIASKEMVVKMGKAGMLGYLGTGGINLVQIEESIKYIQKELVNGEPYGANLFGSSNEESIIDLYLKKGVKNIETSAFIQVTPSIVNFRLKGLSRDDTGAVVIGHKIMAKLSSPDVAELFLRPAPERIVKKLLDEKKITEEQASLSSHVPMADDICIEGDSGGHTDGGNICTLMPVFVRLRDEMMKKYNYKKKIRLGAAGGIGTPEAAAAAFILGADFILTGSINQCSVEAGTSDVVKGLLQSINVQDTAYAPAGDMFEFGARVQVLKKGVFFPMRANKLYELYRQYNSIDEIDAPIKKQLEEKYFKRSLNDVYEDLKRYFSASEIESASKNGKQKMALIFKWYLGYAMESALTGNLENVVNFQVMCGPAMGAFNQWVKGTELENWENRNVDRIGIEIMDETARILNKRYFSLKN